METGGLLSQIASTGIVGVFLVIALIALHRRDGELQTEKNLRIADAGKYLELALALQKDVIVAVKTLGEIVEKWERREEERERADHLSRTQQIPLPLPDPPPTKKAGRT